MINSLKSSFLLTFVLLKRARNLKNKIIIFNYIAQNILQRFLKGVKIPKEIFVEMKDLKFWFATGQSELSPYAEICYNHIYEIDNRFIPKSGDVVFDIGGHIGIFTIRQAKRVNLGKIFVFEPNPETFQRYLKNIKANELKNVYSFNKAVTFRENETTLRLSEGSSEATTIMKEGTVNTYNKEIRIGTVSLDEVVEKYSISKINLMKIDVEGAELEVLESGLKKALLLTEKIVIETHSPYLKNEVNKKLSGLGFKVVLETPSGENALGKNTLMYLYKVKIL
jgi:FkbM family methyltransferase